MKRLGLAALSSLFMLSLTVVSGLCQEVTVGVAEGDYFVYDRFIDGHLWVINELPEIYDFFQTWNTTDWERREVIAVSGTVITFNVTTRYVNGTETNNIADYNLTASDDLWAIGANMDVGEYVGNATGLAWGLDWNEEVYIDETMQWTYENETRDTNTASCWQEQGNRSMWWDKQTGVLVKEGVGFGVYLMGGTPTGEFYVNAWQLLTHTNRWDIPEFPSGTAMALVFVAVTVCVDIYRRRKLLK